MATIPSITPNPQPFPLIGQSQAAFDANSDYLWSSYFPSYETEINNTISIMNSEITGVNSNTGIATTKASEASASAAAALVSENNASGSAAAALASEQAAAVILDNFDDRYLGSKTVDPTLDNDGNPIQSGALYYNTTSDVMKVYDLELTTWINISFTPTSHSALSDLANDDHSQYHNDARGDARYYLQSQVYTKAESELLSSPLPIVSSKMASGSTSLNVTTLETTDTVLLYGTNSTSGYIQTKEELAGTQSVIPPVWFDGLNYVKKIEGAGFVATLQEPSFGLYDRKSPSEARDVRLSSGDWFTTLAEVEQVTNGKNLVTTTGWTAVNAILSAVGGELLVADAGGFSMGYQEVTTEIGVPFRVTAECTDTGDPLAAASLYIFSAVPDGTSAGDIADINPGNGVTGVRIAEFIPTTTSVFIAPQSGGAFTSKWNNITAFNNEVTIGAKLPPQTYLEDGTGKLRTVTASGGVISSIGLGNYVSSIVTESITVDEYKGGNACTGFISFDGVNETIKSINGVTGISKSADGVHKVTGLFDNINGSVVESCGTRNSSSRFISPTEIEVLTYTNAGTLASSSNISVHIFGGKK